MAIQMPSWRRRVAFYVLVVVVAGLGMYYLERAPKEVDLVFVLTGVDVSTGERRLERGDLTALSAEVVRDGEALARTSFSFRRPGPGAPTNAPLQTSPVPVRLRKGEHDVHVRLVFDDGGAERTFALRRKVSVEEDVRVVFVDVGR